MERTVELGPPLPAEQLARAADRSYTVLLQERGVAAIVDTPDGREALAAARDGWAAFLIDHAELALDRGAHTRLWAMHHAAIDEVQRDLRRDLRAANAPPTPELLERRRVLLALLIDAGRFFEALLARLHPAAAAAVGTCRHHAAAPVAGPPQAAAPSGGSSGNGALAALASSVCVACGDLRRYESALPGQEVEQRQRLVASSRRCYLSASYLTPADGRPHNCLGALLAQGGFEDSVRAARHYALAMGAGSE
ncbi:hypothetical protein Ctob_015727 [Chrysochromulina tobinii]|uniref:Uncharacterized protein n=1 Tax=Chrysochromulina tobinii TaxID=1460289 RepID=A0A0M0LRZ7_9EUKA|nr:hypothetical protein Ctob_015727 [Chrysochromulina tobinii]|eukprot:KOO53677.1 hypothetical protein Ctob_015727 [Chrysochromulina sp. CCMP291]